MFQIQLLRVWLRPVPGLQECVGGAQPGAEGGGGAEAEAAPEAGQGRGPRHQRGLPQDALRHRGQDRGGQENEGQIMI